MNTRRAASPLYLNAFLFLFVPSPHPATAQLLGPEFQVNSYTTSHQASPAVAADGSGNFVVVWESYYQDGSLWGAFGQRFNSAGSPVGSEFQVNSFTTGAQGAVEVAGGVSGSFVVVWESSGGQDGSTEGVFAQRFNSAGAKVGSEFQVNTYTTWPQRAPTVAADSSGNFVVAWVSYGQDGGQFSARVFGQRFSSAGSTMGSEFQVNSYTTGEQKRPAIAEGGSGNFVVVWNSGYNNQDGSGYGVFGQRFNAAGSKLGSEFRINSYTTSDQVFPAVAADGSNNFVVVWASKGQDGSGYGVFGQRFDAAGSEVGSEFQVNSYTTGDQQWVAVAEGSSGGFAVVWSSFGQDGSRSGVFGQQFNSAGGKVGGEFQVNSYTTQDQDAPAVAADGSGNFVVAWEGTQGESGAGVFGQRVAGPSSGCAADGNTLCLNNNRFRVEVTWRNYAGQTGSGQAVPFRTDSGLFWFFGPSNLEMLIKVINGCGLNQRYWVYAAATTDVEYQLTVTDTATGLSRQYANTLGNRAAAITDSSAFASCGSSFDSPAPNMDLQLVTEPGDPFAADVMSGMGTAAWHGDGSAPTAPDAILYDQMSGAVGAAGAVMSQDFETARDIYDTLAADDFVVPASGWSITSVEVDGQYSEQGPAASFHVYFYADNSGQPGALLAARLAQPYTGSAGDAAISLTTPVVLPAGTYWISVQARQDEIPNGWWFWGNRTLLTNNSAVWKNSGNGWGTGCTDWGDKLACLPGLRGPDQRFRLNGSANSPTGCAADGVSLCLNNDRFRVSITWRDYSHHTGSGWAVPYANDSGMFWFFAADNIEFLVKVIDGCGLNSKYWVYAAATTDVEYTMTVTDTLRNVTKTYTNPLGTASPAITDSSAFATCP